MIQFKEKVAIVTGSGQGLGRAAATRLAELGCAVLINDIDEERAQTTCNDLNKQGYRTANYVGDISNPTAAAELIKTAQDQLGGVHILVNNAGILRDCLLIKMSEADFDDVIRINLKGVFNCGQAAARAMIEQEQGGAIVNISSIAHLGNVGQSNYAAAKAGVVALSNTWALELARYHIRVNAVAPGLMDTSMIESVPEKLLSQMIAHIPLRRTGKPEELANAIAFLASDASTYITGQTLHLDGGATVGM